ncbi:MAG TPA: response regulator [Candidatus Binatia bacterium]|nr:response regulator [Candidatus Binatia bacterium]
MQGAGHLSSWVAVGPENFIQPHGTLHPNTRRVQCSLTHDRGGDPAISKKPRVLCIDDQVTNLRIRTMLLEQFGCEAIAVHDHQSALHAIAGGDVDVLVIDYHLADGETGEDIARDVRVMHPEIPLIMLTGDANLPPSACECVDAVLTKGVSNPAALLDLIEKLVPEAELRPRRQMLFGEPEHQPRKIGKGEKAS